FAFVVGEFVPLCEADADWSAVAGDDVHARNLRFFATIFCEMRCDKRVTMTAQTPPVTFVQPLGRLADLTGRGFATIDTPAILFYAVGYVAERRSVVPRIATLYTRQMRQSSG